MADTTKFKSTEVVGFFQSRKTLKQTVKDLFLELPEGAQNIQICVRMPNWVKNFPIEVLINNITYPVAITRKKGSESEIIDGEVWVECTQAMPELRHNTQ